MNRNYSSVAFMRAINPLLSDGSISNEDAVFLVNAYKQQKDHIVRIFIEKTHINKTMEDQIMGFLTQDC